MPARPVLRCLVARFVVGGFCSLPLRRAAPARGLEQPEPTKPDHQRACRG